MKCSMDALHGLLRIRSSSSMAFIIKRLLFHLKFLKNLRISLKDASKSTKKIESVGRRPSIIVCCRRKSKR
jgi:hypothetical protein